MADVASELARHSFGGWFAANWQHFGYFRRLDVAIVRLLLHECFWPLSFWSRDIHPTFCGRTVRTPAFLHQALFTNSAFTFTRDSGAQLKPFLNREFRGFLYPRLRCPIEAKPHW